MKDIAGVYGILAGDGIIAEEPQHDTQQYEDQGLHLAGGQLVFLAGGIVPGSVLHAAGNAVALHLLGPFRLPDGQHKDHQRRQHNGGDHAEVAGVAHQGVAHGGGGEHHAQHQHQNTAGGAHQVDNGVGLGPQGLHGHVRHQRHGRGAEGGHGHQDHQQHGDEKHQRAGMLRRHLPCIGLPGGCHIVGVVRVGDGVAVAVGDLAADGGELALGEFLGQHELLAVRGEQLLVRLTFVDGGEGGGIVDIGGSAQMLQLGVVDKTQADQRHGGHQCAQHNEGSAPSAAVGASVGDGAEQGQHEQGQHVVRRHDHAGPGLAHAELVGEDQGNGVVIGLPEGADQEKGKAHQNGAFVVEFHDAFSSKM